MKLKGGILIIGSLLWDLNNKIGFRENWRRKRLMMKNEIHVKAPIRYGRRSGEKKNFTMIFSKECENENKLGTAYLIPFKNNTIKSFKGVENQARFLSKAEGANDNNLKKGEKNEWCTIGILLNPEFNKELKNQILSKWKSKLLNDGGLKDITIYKSVLSNEGEIKINWLKAINRNEQKVVDEFDFILATCTKPTEDPYPDEEIISKDIIIDERKYFFKNIQNGITTFQDRKILKECKPAPNNV